MDRLGNFFGGSRGGEPSPQVSCEDALRLVHEFLDGELEDVSASDVKAHFDTCERCYPNLRFEQSFRDAVRRAASRETAPPELRERLARAIAESGAGR